MSRFVTAAALVVPLATAVTAAAAQEQPVEVTVQAGAGLWQLIVTLIVGLGGIAIGAMLTASYQHRQWLRNTRQSAYSDLLLALDHATDAGNSHVGSVRLYAERYLDDDAEPMDQLVAMKMADDSWQPWHDARDALARAAMTIELVAPQHGTDRHISPDRRESGDYGGVLETRWS